MSSEQPDSPSASVDLYWLPLGAGDNTHCVRINGRVFEWTSAWLQRREPQDLYHAALEVRTPAGRFVIEMAPVWSTDAPDRGVVCEGPVGMRWLGRSRLFRYEVRCWRGGSIPDVAAAVGGPVRLTDDPEGARRVLARVASFPCRTWGRDELAAGEMWNSNSLASWLLASAGLDTDGIAPPLGGRAPGWRAGIVAAARGD